MLSGKWYGAEQRSRGSFEGQARRTQQARQDQDEETEARGQSRQKCREEEKRFKQRKLGKRQTGRNAKQARVPRSEVYRQAVTTVWLEDVEKLGLGLTDMGFSGSVPSPILGSSKILISNISAERGYQILVTKICNGGRISHILTDFIPNISAHPLLVIK